jgi:hypothetical protein
MGIWRSSRAGNNRERRWQLVEAVVPSDFLDEIDLALEIDAKGWSDDLPAICHGSHGEAETSENSLDLGIRHGSAEQHRQPIPTHMQLQRFANRRIDVDDWSD